MTEANTSRFQPGSVVAQRFEIIEQLGSSEGGDVYLVEETERKRRMVLKHLAIPYVGDEGYEKLRQEIVEASQIRHKNLVQVYGLGKEQEDLFLAMEHVDGETLSRHLQRRREKGQIMGLKAVYNLMAHISNALQVVHEAGSMHGALTTRNIYITKQGRVKVANLVYAKLVSKHLASEHRGAFFDSPFVAPETKEANGELTPAADIYSMGLLCAELLSESSLEDYTGDVESFIEEVVSKRSTAIQDLLFSAVVKLPHLRQQSLRDFKAGLKEAVDAPSDTELSSIVMGVGELQNMALAAGIEAADAPQRKPDLFDIPDIPTKSRQFFDGPADSDPTPMEKAPAEEEIWLVQKDGLDYGPFDRATVLAMLYKDEITEHSSTLNMLTQRRAELVDIPDFRDEVLEYVPIRNERMAKEQAERERKIEQVKTAGKFSGAGLVIGALVIIGLSVFAYLQLPDPIPFEFGGAITTFPHAFTAPEVKEVALKLDNAMAMAVFDPEKSKAEREAALTAWAEEHQKRIAAKRKKRRGHRKSRPAAGSNAGAAQGDDVQTISFAVGEDGEALEPLDDWEVEEQLYSSSSLRRQAECFEKAGRASKVTVHFTIAQSGQVRSVSTTASGTLDQCLKRVFQRLRFRQFGGTIKKVTYPIEFG